MPAYETVDNEVYKVDTDPPTAVITALVGDYYVGDFEVVVTFSEPVTGFGLDDIEVESGAVEIEFAETYDLTVPRQEFRLNVNLVGRPVDITLALKDGAGIVDRAGLAYRNPGEPAPLSQSRMVRPLAGEESHKVTIRWLTDDFTVGLELEEPAPSDGSPFTVLARFSHDVSEGSFGNQDSDLIVTNGNWYDGGIELIDARTFRIAIYPQSQGETDIEISIQIPADAAVDMANRSNNQASNTVIHNITVAPPTPSIALAAGTRVDDDGNVWGDLNDDDESVFSVVVAFNEDMDYDVDDETSRALIEVAAGPMGAAVTKVERIQAEGQFRGQFQKQFQGQGMGGFRPQNAEPGDPVEVSVYYAFKVEIKPDNPNPDTPTEIHLKVPEGVASGLTFGLPNSEYYDPDKPIRYAGTGDPGAAPVSPVVLELAAAEADPDPLTRDGTLKLTLNFSVPMDTVLFTCSSVSQ